MQNTNRLLLILILYGYNMRLKYVAYTALPVAAFLGVMAVVIVAYPPPSQTVTNSGPAPLRISIELKPGESLTLPEGVKHRVVLGK